MFLEERVIELILEKERWRDQIDGVRVPMGAKRRSLSIFLSDLVTCTNLNHSLRVYGSDQTNFTCNVFHELQRSPIQISALVSQLNA